MRDSLFSNIKMLSFIIGVHCFDLFECFIISLHSWVFGYEAVWRLFLSSLWATFSCVWKRTDASDLCLSVKSYFASIREAPAQECDEFPVSSWGLCIVFPVSGSQAFSFFILCPCWLPVAGWANRVVWGTGNISGLPLVFSRSGRWEAWSERGSVWRDGWRRHYAMLLVGVLWVLPMLALALLSSEGDEWVGTGWRLVRPHGHPDRERTGQKTGNIERNQQKQIRTDFHGNYRVKWSHREKEMRQEKSRGSVQKKRLRFTWELGRCWSHSQSHRMPWNTYKH